MPTVGAIAYRLSVANLAMSSAAGSALASGAPWPAHAANSRLRSHEVTPRRHPLYRSAERDERDTVKDELDTDQEADEPEARRRQLVDQHEADDERHDPGERGPAEFGKRMLVAPTVRKIPPTMKSAARSIVILTSPLPG